MTTTQWRDEFMAAMGAAGVRVGSARALLVLARRAQRLAEARCNGDWPADNGVRETQVCPVCGGGWAPSTFRRNREDPKGARICPDCRCEQDMHALVAADWPEGWGVVTTGDPRGAVVSLVRPGAERTHGYFQHRDLVAVPS